MISESPSNCRQMDYLQVNNDIPQLYEEFHMLKQYLDSSKKKKQMKQQSSNKKSSKKNSQIDTKHDRIKQLISTPQPRKTLTPQQTSSPSPSPYNLQPLTHHPYLPSRSHLIQEYTQLYQYSIKKVIEMGNRGKKKRRTNDQHDDHSTVEKQNHLYKNINKQPLRQKENHNIIAKKLQFTTDNLHSYSHQKENLFTEGQINLPHHNEFQSLFIKFQSNIQSSLDHQFQRLSTIDHQLNTIKDHPFHKNANHQYEVHNQHPDEQVKMTLKFEEFHEQLLIENSSSICSEDVSYIAEFDQTF